MHGGGAFGGEAEGWNSVPERADSGRAVSERKPRGHTTTGDRGM